MLTFKHYSFLIQLSKQIQYDSDRLEKPRQATSSLFDSKSHLLLVMFLRRFLKNIISSDKDSLSLF